MAHFCAPRSAPRDPRSEAELLRQLTSRGRRKARRLKEQRRSAAQVLWHKIIILYPGGACNFSEYLRKEKPWNTKEKLYKINGIINEKRTNYIKITPPEVGGAFYCSISIILLWISLICSSSFFKRYSHIWFGLPYSFLNLSFLSSSSTYLFSSSIHAIFKISHSVIVSKFFI